MPLPFNSNLNLQRKIYSISQLNKTSKQLLEKHFGLIWVEAEISNFSSPMSGHWYFTLKDDQAQIRCAMFRHNNRFTSIVPEDGDKVLIRTKVSVFEPRGDFQLIVEYLEPAGRGALQRQFELLKAKLDSQGLFDASHKKAIPTHIQTLGLITSTTGAAIQDIISVVKRRSPMIKIVIYPVKVQGDDAAQILVKAINLAQERKEVDVLLLTRGGGSIEDLYCFNDEQLALTIHQCKLPIVSAIGHETDFTIADFISDLRAPTPSAAAELLTNDSLELQNYIRSINQRLFSHLKPKLGRNQQQLDGLMARLVSPENALKQQKQRLVNLNQRLCQSLKHQMQERKSTLHRHSINLQNQSPRSKLKNQAALLAQLRLRQNNAMEGKLNQYKLKTEATARQLNNLSPLATLDRGYSITFNSNNKAILASSEVNIDAQIETLLKSGKIFSKVTKIL